MVKRILSAIGFLLLPISALAQTTDYGPQLTEAALKIQGAISPGCNTTESCVEFVTNVIPRCQRLGGNAGCWCGNHNPLHFCAICMSNPTSNQTSPDQTAAALEGHTAYHVACNAFEAAVNSTTIAGSATSTGTQASATSSPPVVEQGPKPPIGAIVGGAVGGGVVLAIVITGLVLWLRRRSRRNKVAPSSVSLFSAAGTSAHARPYSGYGAPQPGFGHHDGQHAGQRESAFVPGYTPASVPYQTNGLQTPGLSSISDGSYKKHPEPMAPNY